MDRVEREIPEDLASAQFRRHERSGNRAESLVELFRA